MQRDGGRGLCRGMGVGGCAEGWGVGVVQRDGGKGCTEGWG